MKSQRGIPIKFKESWPIYWLSTEDRFFFIKPTGTSQDKDTASLDNLIKNT